MPRGTPVEYIEVVLACEDIPKIAMAKRETPDISVRKLINMKKKRTVLIFQSRRRKCLAMMWEWMLPNH